MVYIYPLHYRSTLTPEHYAFPPCRAFGDAILKGCGLSSDPYTASYILDPAQTYILILSTDGVWDVMTNDHSLKEVSIFPLFNMEILTSYLYLNGKIRRCI